MLIAIGALLVGRSLAKLEDLGVVHVGDQILRFLAELFDLLRLVQVLKEGFLVRVALELLNQLLDLVFAMNARARENVPCAACCVHREEEERGTPHIATRIVIGCDVMAESTTSGGFSSMSRGAA